MLIQAVLRCYIILLTNLCKRIVTNKYLPRLRKHGHPLQIATHPNKPKKRILTSQITPLLTVTDPTFLVHYITVTFSLGSDLNTSALLSLHWNFLRFTFTCGVSKAGVCLYLACFPSSRFWTIEEQERENRMRHGRPIPQALLMISGSGGYRARSHNEALLSLSVSTSNGTGSQQGPFLIR